MEQNRQLENKVCFVTGAAKGLGKGICEQFARDGAIVYANARKEGILDEWARDLGKEYKTSVFPVYFDILDTEIMKKSIETIYKQQHCLDVLVNNAGITKNEIIGMIKEETVRKLFETNVFAPIQALQFAARIMKRQKKGCIINISSIIGEVGAPYELVYSGTKGALIAITKSAAKELAEFGIRVNSVAPGYADTDMFHDAAGDIEKEQYHIDRIGLGRLAKPYDIANAVSFLASDRAEYITGHILDVNGGAII